MRSGIFKILITGGAGFIGSAFVREIMKDKAYKIVVVDKLTYAGDLKRLGTANKKYVFYRADICDKKRIDSIFEREAPDAVVNLAAATHVDRSILDSSDFIKTNVIGTQILLDISRKNKIKKFVHISTDEVYGEIKRGSFFEDSPLKPNSPYAASKAAADLLIKAYIRTYGFPALIVRPCNNYGPWQYPEKLIPLAILRILKNKKIPLFADGKNIREWLYVEDCAKAIAQILKKGKPGKIYNLGSNQERQNIETVKMILKIIKKPTDMIEFVIDRPGHDIRYSLNSQKVFKEIKWSAKVDLKDGLKNTVQWYLKHKEWLLNKWKEISKLYKFN